MGVMRDALLWASGNQCLRTHVPRWPFVRRAVRQFMPGERIEDALGAASTLADKGIATTFTKLGENLSDAGEIDGVVDAYVDAYAAIRASGLDTEVSVKLTQLGLDLDQEATASAVIRLAAAAQEHGTWLWIDMEASDYVDRTLDIYRRVKADFDHVGVCLQAYLHRTPADIEALAPLRPGIRLVKGAYKEPASAAVVGRSDIDEAFFRIGMDLISRPADGLRLAVASHDVDLLDRLEAAAAGGRPGSFEVHMLYGIRMADQYRYAERGYHVRTLISYGHEWYPWYVRRLAERPANLGFVARNLFARS